MKDIISLILIVTVLATTTRCSKTGNVSDEQITNNKTPPSSSSQTLKKDEFTHDNITALFMEEKETDAYQVFESVIVDDDKIPQLKAVILFYDKEANNSSNLAFMVKNSKGEIIFQETTFAVNEVEGIRDYDSSGLTYKGNGEVEVSAYNSGTGEVLNFTVIYSYEESTSSTNFKIITEQS